MVRFMTHKDMDAVCNCIQQLFSIEHDFHFNTEHCRKALNLILSSSSAFLFIAEKANELAGIMSIQSLISTAEGGYSGLVEDLFVVEKYRNQGIGTLLLKHAYLFAAQKGWKRLQLLADKNNIPALSFYHNNLWQKTNMTAFKRLIGNTK
jgi:GNAT superfamily N-acetyltransferase